jgi:hypothetical protein
MWLILLGFVLQEKGKEKKLLTYREMRFLHFASVEYKGVIYMTPQDFLESVTEDMPRRRFYDISMIKANSTITI